MDTEKPLGASMHDPDSEARKEAARMLGSARTERKVAHARALAESRKGVKLTPEQIEKQREAQRARREREKQEKIAAGLLPAEPPPKRPRGRPKKSEAAEEAPEQTSPAPSSPSRQDVPREGGQAQR